MKLIVEKLAKSFGKQKVFKNVNFELESGDIVALIGRNGSGKTTLMQTIVTILRKDYGKVYIEDGDNIIDLDEKPEKLVDIVYIPDRFDYFKNSNLRKVMKYYDIIYPDFDEEYCLEKIKELGLDNDKTMGSYSKGQLTLIATIIGISTNSRFLLIDEPYDGVDVINSKIMDSLIIEASERGVGLFISSHQLEKLEKISNKIFFLEEKRGVNTYESDEESNIRKLQIVSSENFDDELESAKDIVVVQKMGRVATIIYSGNQEKLDKIFENINIIQHDELKVNVEDIFLWNSRGKKRR